MAQPEKALADAEQAVSLDPNNEEYRNLLERINVIIGNRQDERDPAPPLSTGILRWHDIAREDRFAATAE